MNQIATASRVVLLDRRDLLQYADNLRREGLSERTVFIRAGRQ